MRLRHLVLAGVPTVLAAGAVTTTATAATTADEKPAITAVPLTETPVPSDTRLGTAGGGRTFTINPETGAVVSITKGRIFNPTISTQNSCPSGMPCYTAPVPNTQQGFFGTPGTISGSWANRNGYNSGVQTVSACWVIDRTPKCNNFGLNPGNRIAFSPLVRGTSFTIYS